jgi:hypothetical protein
MAADPSAMVENTGQTISYAMGDDGYYQTGISSPNPRFIDNEDGTVTDKNTGLVWLKNVNCYDTQDCYTAMSLAGELKNGECGLSDGSAEGDWRLPTKQEFQEIGTDPQTTWDWYFPDDGTWTVPSLPFFNVVDSLGYFYWSSTEVGGK